MLKGNEEDADRTAFDELGAKCLGFLDAHVSFRAERVSAAAPEQAVVMNTGEAGEFAADGFKDLGVPEARHDEAELGERGGAAAVSRGIADIGAGAGAARNEALGLEVAQGAAHGGARDAKPFHKLGFAGQAVTGSIFSGVDLRRELAGNGAVFEAVGHGKSASSRFQADRTAFF